MRIFAALAGALALQQTQSLTPIQTIRKEVCPSMASAAENALKNCNDELSKMPYTPYASSENCFSRGHEYFSAIGPNKAGCTYSVIKDEGHKEYRVFHESVWAEKTS